MSGENQEPDDVQQREEGHFFRNESAGWHTEDLFSASSYERPAGRRRNQPNRQQLFSQKKGAFDLWKQLFLYAYSFFAG